MTAGRFRSDHFRSRNYVLPLNCYIFIQKQLTIFKINKVLMIRKMHDA